jgi:hypothetical protein
MTTRLGDLLDDARRRTFVGRRGELAGFDDMLAGRSPRRVLLVHGPGGIGKTTLLLEFRTRAREAGRTVVLLDGREVDPSPDGFRNAVGSALPDGAVLPDGVVLPGGAVLLVDGYEQLGPIDGWLRQEFLPALPADGVVVLAGREAPAAPWRSDPGWRSVVGVHRLGDFDEAESGELLERAGVAPPDRPQLMRLGRGHPLAMALLADAALTGAVPDRLAEVPDLISALLESLLTETLLQEKATPAEAHMAGLAACATAWLTTEDLLRQVVGTEAGEVWTWLARRPFVSCGPNGLFPHDLARDVLDAEFERRWPERYRVLHRVVHDHLVAGLRSGTGPSRPMMAQHLLYLHRRSPLTEIIGSLRAQGSVAVVPARAEDHAQASSFVQIFEGSQSARLAERWFADRPEAVSVVRDSEGVAGFSFHVIHPTGSPLEDDDPVTRSVLDHAARLAPARPGEQIDIARFLAGRREHQADPYAALAGAVSSLLEWVSRPLAWSFMTIIDDAFWGPFFEYLAFTRQLEVEFGGRVYVVYGNDWRRLPLGTWFDLMNERAHSGGTGPPPASLLRPPPLDRARFAAAVRSALQDLRRPDRLAASPLMGSSLAAAPSGPSAERLGSTLVNAVDGLGDQALGAVLRRTFVRGAPTQEAAAEVLGLPFSTYRRHLAKAIEQLTDVLWAVEIGEVRLPGQPGLRAGPGWADTEQGLGTSWPGD